MNSSILRIIWCGSLSLFLFSLSFFVSVVVYLYYCYPSNNFLLSGFLALTLWNMGTSNVRKLCATGSMVAFSSNARVRASKNCSLNGFGCGCLPIIINKSKKSASHYGWSMAQSLISTLICSLYSFSFWIGLVELAGLPLPHQQSDE